MGKRFSKMPQPEGVDSGATATCRIPVGRRIHSLHLMYQYDADNQNVSHFNEIRIYANDEVIQRFSGTERDKMNQFDGLEASQGILEIPFDRRKLKTVAGQEETAINTGKMAVDDKGFYISSMYMEIDIDDGATIGATDLSLYAKESDALAGGPGVIPFIRKEKRSVAGADSNFQISDLVNPGVNAPDKYALNRITFMPSGGATIKNLGIERNQYRLFDRPDALNRAIQKAGVRTPQADYYTIDSTENGHGGEPIELFGMTDYRYLLDVSGATTITCLSEYFGALTR